MKNHVLTLILLFPAILLMAQYNWQWTITEGQDLNEIISAVDCDEAGNLYSCGTFRDTVDFFGTQLIASGNIDTYVACFDPIGTMLWVQQGGGIYEDGAHDICVSGQSVFVTGMFTEAATFETETLLSAGARDMFLLKYDLEGNLVWATSGGSVVDDDGHSVAADELGNIYVTGDMNYIATFGSHTVEYYGFSDIYLVKYDTDGNCQWAKSAGGPIYDDGSCVEVKGEHLFLAGAFNDEAVFDTATISSVGSVDIFIAHYLTDGSFVEVITAGGDNNEGIQCMAVDDDMSVYIGGWYMLNISFGTATHFSSGSNDIFLAKYSPGNGFSWSQSYGGMGLDAAWGMTCDNSNRLLFTGTFENTLSMGTATFASEGFDDGFACRFHPDGTIDWVYQIGGSGSVTARDCAADQDDNYYIAGDFVEELHIGNQTFSSNGAYDLFFSRLAEGGIFIPENASRVLARISLYPNPVTTQCKIDLYLHEGSATKLVLMDARGKIIQTLYDGFIPAGRKMIGYAVSQLSPGLYLCTLTTQWGTQTTPLIIQ